jgi:tetratricopeptide (TPR) repeat protein
LANQRLAVNGILVVAFLLFLLPSCVSTMTNGGMGYNADQAHEYYRQGLRLGKDRHYAEAAAAFEKAVALNPRYKEAYLFAASSYFLMGRCDKAIGFAQQALAIDPNYADAYDRLLFCLFIQKRFPETIDTANTLIALPAATNDAVAMQRGAYYTRALANGALGRYKQSAEDFRHYLQVTPVTNATRDMIAAGKAVLVEIDKFYASKKRTPVAPPVRTAAVTPPPAGKKQPPAPPQLQQKPVVASRPEPAPASAPVQPSSHEEAQLQAKINAAIGGWTQQYNVLTGM